MLSAKLHLVRIIAKQEEKRSLLTTLQDLGIMHLRPAKIPEPFAADLVEAEVDEVSKLLLELQYIANETEIQRTFSLEGLPAYDKVMAHAKEFVASHLEKVRSLAEKRKEVEGELTTLEAQRKILEDIPFVIRQPRSPKASLFLLKSKNDFSFSFKKAKINIKKIHWKNQYYFAVAVASSKQKEFVAYVKTTPLKQINLSFLEGNSTSHLEKVSSRIAQINKEQEEIRKELFRKVNGKQSKICFLLNALENYHEQFKISTLLKKSKHLFALEGYVEKKEIEQLKEKFPQALIAAEPAKEGAPTKFKNNPYSKSYELITELFGMPKYGAIDPTFLVSLFFPFFFGFMLGDVGYGLTLLLLVAVVRFKFGKNTPAGTKIFFWSALSSIFFGLLFGSFFGDLVEITPLYQDAFSASFTILKASLIIGLLHLNLAVFLKIYQMWKFKKSWKTIIFQASPFPLLQAAACAFFLGSSALGVTALFLAVVFLIKEKSVFGIMDISGFFGTWFSYARLLALSLATAGVALAVNVIAQKALTLGIIGVLLSILVIIVGHTFNFGLSILGCAIHAARLHYVEFFSFFFEGDGYKFKPFYVKNLGGKK